MFLVFVPMPFLWNPQHFLLANLLPFSVMRQCELKPMSCGWYGLLLSSPPPPPPPSNRPCKMNACPTNTADNHPQPTSTLTTAWQPRHAAALPPQWWQSGFSLTPPPPPQQRQVRWVSRSCTSPSCGCCATTANANAVEVNSDFDRKRHNGRWHEMDGSGAITMDGDGTITMDSGNAIKQRRMGGSARWTTAAGWTAARSIDSGGGGNGRQ